MYGDGPASYSALMMMYDEWYTDTHPVGYQVVGGNDRFPAIMAAKLGNAIRYGARILAVTSDSTKVRVTVESSGTQQVVEGDYAICALPFTVLRDLPISPALNPARKVGLLYTPCTSVVRVCMEFKRPFWLQDDNLCGLAITDLPIQITYPQPNQPGPSAVLNQLMTGENARQMAVGPKPTGCSSRSMSLRNIFRKPPLNMWEGSRRSGTQIPGPKARTRITRRAR